ncbi:MAG: sodium-dependent transporter [Desulfobacteraceae bacterium]|nr:sodium-dependent transporter [Desulfobacteraceae bacterium]
MAKREQWGTRSGFVLAAVGSAIGLGNIWRFPYMAYDNGGGAFLIPYFFALLTAGIPIIILEFGVGHKYRGSAPMTFFNIFEKWEWLGWWQALVSFVISVYYVVVISWALNYAFFAMDLGWGASPEKFFFEEFLQLSNGPMDLGGIVWPVFAAAIAMWAVTWIVLFSGVKKGIELANKIFMPLLFLLLLIMLVRAVTLEGAAQGIDWLFRPDFSAIADYRVWTAAYGQIFFTLSVCFAIMITYSSYLPAKSDINNNAMMTAFINCGFSLLAGIMVFGVLGHMAAKQDVALHEIVTQGVGMAFVTIPEAVNLLPAPEFFGFLFFLSLVFAGLSSMISISEACCSSLIDKFGWDRKPTTSLFCLVGFMLSLIFMTRGGLFILDITDHFINNFGIVFAGLVEVILLSWFFKLDTVRQYANSLSDFAIGTWWNFCLKVITPVVLGYMAVANLAGDIRENYEGYDGSALVMFGWCVVAGIVLLSFVLQSMKSAWAQKTK